MEGSAPARRDRGEVSECYNFVVSRNLAEGVVVPSNVPTHVGEWLSLVEHLVRDQGVGGSNPLSPTIFFNDLAAISVFSSTLL